MQSQDLLLIYKNQKKMRFQPQKMLPICILLFLQCSNNSTMFVGWLPYIIKKKNPTSKFAPHLLFLKLL